jgi:hypothetical protein
MHQYIEGFSMWQPKLQLEMEQRPCFGTLAWLDGICPKNLSPMIFALSKKKNRIVQHAMVGNVWLWDLMC